MGDATGLDRISLARDSDGGLIREGRFLRAALEAADGRIAALEAEVAKLRRERDEARLELTRARYDMHTAVLVRSRHVTMLEEVLSHDLARAAADAVRTAREAKRP